MGQKDLIITAAVAGVTMFGALGVFAPHEVDASLEGERSVAIDGVDVSIVTTKARRRPTVRLSMLNNTDEAVVLSGTLSLYETSVKDMGGRMARPPIERWQRDCLYVLNAGEKKTVRLRAKKRLKKGSMASFAFRAGGEDLYTASFVPKVPKEKRAAVTEVAGLIREADLGNPRVASLVANLP